VAASAIAMVISSSRFIEERTGARRKLAVWFRKTCFVTIQSMQSFDTRQSFVVGRIEDLRPGECVSYELPDGNELAVYNVGGEFYATENSCPHRGAPLSEGALCGHIIECGLHGWQFDVRDGECLTVPEKIKTYAVRIEDGLITVDLTNQS
jgi:nitrite reductase/ring-hydroxylating ferredoxin subunit